MILFSCGLASRHKVVSSVPYAQDKRPIPFLSQTHQLNSHTLDLPPTCKDLMSQGLVGYVMQRPDEPALNNLSTVASEIIRRVYVLGGPCPSFGGYTGSQDPSKPPQPLLSLFWLLHRGILPVNMSPGCSAGSAVEVSAINVLHPSQTSRDRARRWSPL
jgi:hypothetical protein